MTILVAVKKNGRVFLGADRITTFGNEYVTDLVGGSKIMKLKNAYLATSGYTLLDNVIEHLYHSSHKMMENSFKDRAHVFSFFLDLYNELKKSYTLVDPGKDTYATMYNVFLVVTPKSIFGVSTNLSVNEYERFAARGAGSDYSQGCLYGIYDLIDDGLELTRLALEAACHFSIYCKEPLDIIEVRAKDFSKPSSTGHKVSAHELKTIRMRMGAGGLAMAGPSKNGSTSSANIDEDGAPVPKTGRLTKVARATATRRKVASGATRQSGAAGKKASGASSTKASGAKSTKASGAKSSKSRASTKTKSSTTSARRKSSATGASTVSARKSSATRNKAGSRRAARTKSGKRR